MARKQTRQDAEIDVVDWLRKLPKVELHLHLEGTIQLDTLLELSKRHDAEPLTSEAAKKLYVYENFLGFMDSFKAVSARLVGPDDYELITYNMVRDLAAQGVVHAEVYISFGIIYYWKNAEVEPYVEAIERGRVRGEKDFRTTVYWLIDAVRHFGAEEAVKVFRKAAELRRLYPSIVGIGIGGDEARGSADLFKESYAEAKTAGLRLTAHAGETIGPESIWAAINIGAERVGHALSAQHDAELLEVLAERQIPLELNVTSNIRTGCCKSFDEHPVKHYFETGLMVTINSDDPPMFGSNLLEEYVLVQSRFEFSLEQMRELAANAVEASFLPPERKLELLRQVEQYRY
ncbi:adenosine deaminase [Tunturibacter empetritectus]|uniref:Adenosine deaminase/aminodeoxyfutalosine deaminase n=1 Tax=Tunturiibacter lichenicola TaxID=2051959 RepID=A0A7W8J6G2_9BACT|nr:adenosine deaminase [Edaphobacter lichenicola]MBB5343435.1 adenosine deaminase/aminodeoxyfutalosine deaminase [Edaphobacter lichenicola]